MISARINTVEFVGSFHTLDQVPSDKRPHVAFAGRSNVGKSSLLNRLVGRRKMAKVSNTPGKTRSLNFFLVDDRYYFVDLPGYGYARVSKELRISWGRMIETYLNECRNLAGLVLLLDSRRDPTDEDYQLLEWLAARKIPALIAVTKTDKLSRSKAAQKVAAAERAFGASALPFSAVTGEGKKELIGSIYNLVNEHFANTRA